MYRKVGIICAADVELAPFLPRIENNVITEIAMMKFHQGTLCGVPVAAVECGVCRVNAAAAAQIMIDKFGVDAIINTGTAGGMGRSVALFDTVVSARCAYHDVDGHFLKVYHPCMTSDFFESDKALLGAAVRAARKNAELSVHFGTTVTGEQFIDDEYRDEINAKFRPLAVDMETAGIAHVCYINNIPFIAVRTVTDTAEHSGIANFRANCVRAGEISERFVEKMLGEIIK
jgi:adenosylhomocysteine nucleosidase